MSEETSGGTPGEQTSAPDTFTQEQVNEQIEAAKKDAINGVWSKMQSDKDHEVSGYKKLAEQAIETLKGLEAKDEATKIEAMSPDERTAYFSQKTYERSAGIDPTSAPGSPGLSSPPAGGAPGADTPSGSETPGADQAKQVLAQAVKDAGLDPEKVDFSGGIGEFLKSVVKLTTPEQTPEERNAALELEKAANRPAPSGGSAGENLLKMNPIDIIRNGRGNEKSPWDKFS
jgi:hypothetical protein